METEKVNEVLSLRDYWFGLDVSKSSFTAAFCIGFTKEVITPSEKSYEITRKGVHKFLKWRKSILKVYGNLVPDGIVMESTSFYSDRLAKLLKNEDESLYISICNAERVSHYCKSHKHNKTDKQDAELIAMFGADARPAKMTEKSPEIKELKEIIQQRNMYIEELTKYKNRQDSIECREMKAENQRMITILEKSIKKMDMLLNEFNKAHENIKDEVVLMSSVPGVGLLSALSILAELGSLKEYTRNQLSAISGLCPINRQSGSSVNSSRLSRKGSRNLRRILYLDCCQAISKVPGLKSMKERLLARANSSKMTAHCACMRKLLLILRGIVISGKPYSLEYQTAISA